MRETITVQGAVMHPARWRTLDATRATHSSYLDLHIQQWHQWQLAYPTLSSTGTSRFLASSNASGDQGHQSTGLSACWRRYGEVVCVSRLAMSQSSRTHLRVTRTPRGGDVNGQMAGGRGDNRSSRSRAPRRDRPVG